MNKEELKQEINNKKIALFEIAEMQRHLVADLNDLARKIEYSPSDYDSAVEWDHFLEDVAIDGNLSYAGHRPNSYHTSFWIPSGEVC